MNNFTRYINPWLGQLLNKLKLDLDYTRGSGCWLSSGNRQYLDCVAAYGALPFGHNPPEIWSALEEVKNRTVPGFAQPSALGPAAALAKRLIELAPLGLDHVTFTNSGAEAVEAAIKICRAATGRRTILSTYKSFHGKTLGALSATGNPSYQKSFGAPVPGFEQIPYGQATALENYLQSNPEDIAGFIVEPIQGEGGVMVPPPGYLKQVRTICTEYGVPLVIDEIQTGLGRTGRLFACEDEGVCPDLLLLAKALGGGLVPIGAVLTSSAMYSEEYGTKHSSTFAGGALASFAGLAVLDRLTAGQGELLDHVGSMGRYIYSALREACSRYEFVSVRGRGLMLGLDFQIDRSTHPGNLMGLMAEQKLLTPLIASYLLHRHQLRVAPTLNGANVIRVQAPLVIAREEADFLIQGIEKTLQVLDSGDTVALIAHLLASEPLNHGSRGRAATPPVKPAPGQTRFAFLVHPLDEMSFADFDRNLACLNPNNLIDLVGNWLPEMEPFVVGDSVIKSKTGKEAFCEFITIPRTARQLMDMDPEESLDMVRRGVDLAKGRGAQLVGLGAFTSVVSWGGMRLRDQGIPLTTGNSYTVVTAVEATITALNRLSMEPGQAAAAVVGAAGAIGRCTALLFAEAMEQVILLGNPANGERSLNKLTRVAGELCRHVLGAAPASPIGRSIARLPGCPEAGADIDDFVRFYVNNAHQLPITVSIDADRQLPKADVVVTATNSVSELVKPGNVKFGAVICDLSRPANVSREIQRRRPDVLVIDGGVVEIWNRPDLGWDFGFEQGLGYACMAETMLLALEGHLKHTSIGSNISLETLAMIRNLADKHGFRVAELRSFDKPLSERDWQRVIAARAGHADKLTGN